MLASAFMSFSPPIRGAEIGVVRPIGTRIVADSARYVFDLGDGHRSHAAPFGVRRAAENNDAHDQIENSHCRCSLIVIIIAVAALAGPRVIALAPSRVFEAQLAEVRERQRNRQQYQRRQEWPRTRNVALDCQRIRKWATTLGSISLRRHPQIVPAWRNRGDRDFVPRRSFMPRFAAVHAGVVRHLATKV